MKEILEKIKIKREYFILPLLILMVVVILFPQSVNAVDVAAIAENSIKLVAAAPILIALGLISLLVMGVFGVIDLLVISFIVNIVQYNNFINEPTIIDAWVIVRDLCNMFFILILLVVAFATILRIESYQWKKILPKLLIMAILINFSRTICGLIIDASQVVMLTFVSAFGSGGEFINLTKMASYFTGTTLNGFSTKDWSVINVVIGLIIGIMFMIISGIVLIVAMSVFLMRIVMLWIYIVLSPLAFLAAAFPAGQKYATQWWSEFVKYVINGPVLAFFIWMALITSRAEFQSFNFDGLATQCFGNSKIMCMNNFMPFVLSIGMMLGGLIITQQIGGVGSSMAGKGLDWAKKATKAVAGGAVLPVSYLNDKMHERTGVDLNVARVWSGIQEKRKDIKAKRYGRGMQAAADAMRDGGRLHGALAMTGTPGSAWEQLTTKAGWQRRFMGGKESQKKIEPLAEERKASKDAIEAIQSSDEYKEALAVSQSIDPVQRHDISNEQVKLVDELDKLTSAIELAQHRIATAKHSGNEVEEKMATDELEDLKKQKQAKIENISSNERILSQPIRSAKEIIDAKNLVDSKNDEIKNHEKDIAAKNDQILKYKPIMDFDAIAMQGKLESEEMKKIDHIKDREELASMLRDAIKNKDRTRFSAVALKLTKDGNENDGLINNMGYTSNADGLNKLIKSISTKGDKNYMGFSDQQAKALGMKISYAAEANNHWGTARAFTMEDGRYRDSKSKEQAMAAISEIAKMDPQGISRSLNRLGYGGEKPDGTFVLNEFGLALIKTIGPRVAQQMSRFNINAAPRLATPENIKLMVKVGVAPEFINGLVDRSKTKIITAGDAVNEQFPAKK